ncbi:flagellar biosynthesis protein FlgE [Rhodobacter veldkampii DSM 11550]|uniref:Flagellar hook protein FlgE n=1 Tax=Phaeovulum veldkampii DSM 11550 TaxID=1185920 RepID=A0A2T4JIA3_9RHOB|nr:flagellar hook-basal body complex protein [Phaeovulum veldkampii]MBK5947181.1 flagellar biosynthesis protein FlgE [Phaeovulum veldkampii DSM 11550]PTE17640.1 flagellar biosynthesis protein FlgE [Phaeovulum veldkampii DSM 11550]TDQ57536.1 flagellar hook protein FlgE [Phaeovulum veldkampii DSM 11550]
MSISSSLNAGVAGLAANATRLATISDNIANSGTYGYKRAAADFESMVINQSRAAGVYSAGGVRAQTIRLIDERGSLVATANSLDLAVSGRGMLPVVPAVSLDNGTNGQQLMMTTTGAFRTDAEGVLRTESGLVLLGWPASADGTIPTMPRDTVSGLQPVVIHTNQMVGDPTTAIGLGVNLPAEDTEVGASGDAKPLSIEYFGNLGTSETLGITFTPTVPAAPATDPSNQWTMLITDSAQGGAVIGEYTLTFDDSRGTGGTLASVATVSGGAYDPATGTLALGVAGGPLDLTIGTIGGTGGMTQLAGSFGTTSITKDGSPVGNLTAVEVDENGYVRATYDTGSIRTLYQIPLVDVPNVNGLTALNNQTFQISPTSGAFFLWDAGDGPTGAVVGYARESSTTDIAAELTSLIQTQRAYSSNAKVIQTVDEMLQETTNIKR